MRFPKLSTDKRAITPVLSNLLLIIVAVAAMSIAATATYIITANLRETMGERFIVEDVWFNKNGVSRISIYIRNVGKVAITISAVYINNTPVESFTRLELELGDHGRLNVTYPWESGGVHRIKIVTLRGNSVEEYYNAP